MGTKYEDIYERYRARVRNYDLLDYDSAVVNEIQLDLLNLSISDFEDVCVKDLSDRDDGLLLFNIDLSNREKDILALGMVLHFVEPYVYNTDSLRNALNTKDFSLYSPANLLEKMTELMTTTERRLQRRTNFAHYLTLHGST